MCIYIYLYIYIHIYPLPMEHSYVIHIFRILKLILLLKQCYCLENVTKKSVNN